MFKHLVLWAAEWFLSLSPLLVIGLYYQCHVPLMHLLQYCGIVTKLNIFVYFMIYQQNWITDICKNWNYPLPGHTFLNLAHVRWPNYLGFPSRQCLIPNTVLSITFNSRIIFLHLKVSPQSTRITLRFQLPVTLIPHPMPVLTSLHLVFHTFLMKSNVTVRKRWTQDWSHQSQLISPSCLSQKWPALLFVNPSTTLIRIFFTLPDASRSQWVFYFRFPALFILSLLLTILLYSLSLADTTGINIISVSWATMVRVLSLAAHRHSQSTGGNRFLRVWLQDLLSGRWSGAWMDDISF